MSLFLRPSFSYDPFFDDDSSLWRQHLFQQHQLLQDQIDQHNQLQQQKQQNKDNKELPSSSSSSSSSPSSSTAMTKPDNDNTQMSMRKPKRSTFTSLSNIKCDTIENDKQFIINAEIPGIPQENLSVTLDNGVINISGEKKDSYDNEKKDEKTGKTIFHHVERSYGKFSRSFPLPTACLTEVDNANVTYNDNGVLNIIIPKSEQQNISTKRTLSIQKMSKQEKEAKENQ